MTQEYGTGDGSTNQSSQYGSQSGSSSGQDQQAQLKQRMNKLGKQTKRQARRALNATNEQVRQHPTATILLATAAGLLVGMMLTRGQNHSQGRHWEN